METQKHTPGPWQVISTEPHPDLDNESVTFIQTPKLCYDLGFVNSILERDEHEANARLIAAAPELLEALKDVAATKSLIMKRSPSELELQEILKTFERVNEVIKKATHAHP